MSIYNVHTPISRSICTFLNLCYIIQHFYAFIFLYVDWIVMFILTDIGLKQVCFLNNLKFVHFKFVKIGNERGENN